MTSVAAEVVVKGTVVKSLMKFIEKELTREQMEAALSALPPEFASKLKGAILPTSTYPVSLVNKLTGASARAKGEKPEEFAFRAGRTAAFEAVRTVYRLLVMVLTPAALLQKATTMWRTIYSAGDFGVEGAGPGVATVYLRDFPSELIGCARITGWITELGAMTRSQDLEVRHTRCAAKGAGECLWSVKWKP